MAARNLGGVEVGLDFCPGIGRLVGPEVGRKCYDRHARARRDVRASVWGGSRQSARYLYDFSRASRRAFAVFYYLATITAPRRGTATVAH